MLTENAVERSERLAARARAYALDIVAFCERLGGGHAATVIGRQLVRCGTGVGANYRAAARPRSRREFVARMSVALEEADESVWVELAVEAGLASPSSTAALVDEGQQLTAILGASLRTARASL